MTLTKRMRYEILRRDNHTCRYCGAAAPDVALTVDHVIPTALGGTDDATNLVTACRDCNAGKSASSPDAPLVAQVAEDALRWSRAIAAAAETMIERREVIWQYLDAIEAAWVQHGFGLNGHYQAWRPSDWQDSAERLALASTPNTPDADAPRPNPPQEA